MSLRKVDLNLLTVFDAVYTEGNLTRAARRIGLSQPATSNALSRLRHITGDELFLREGRGIFPTERAHKLAPLVRQALGLVEDALQVGGGFDPSANCDFHIAGVDYYEVVVLPRLLRELQRRSSGFQLQASTGISSVLAKPLRYGEIDLIIDYIPLAEPEYRCEFLFEENIVTLHSKGHSSIRGAMTLDDFVAGRHVLRTLREDEPKPEIDALLVKMGKARNVCVTLNNWLALPSAVAGSNLICTVPARMARLYADSLDLVISPVPLDIRPVPVYMIWHESRDASPSHRWLRAQLKRSCRGL